MRKHSATSKAAYDSIKEHRTEMHDKIVEGLKKLRVGGHFEAIAEASGITPAQCHKRLDEMVKAGIVFNTGVCRKTSSGRNAQVRQLVETPPSTPLGELIQKGLF